MAEESPLGGERTEEATPKRREDAHRDGQVPRSTELTTATLLLGGAGVLVGFGPVAATGLAALFASALMLTGAAQLDAGSAANVLQTVGWRGMLLMTPVLMAILAIALAITTVQARGVLSVKPLGPNFKKLDPLKNAKRMLGAQPWMELAKSLTKLTVIGIAVWFGLSRAWGDVMALAQTSPAGLLHVVKHYGARMLVIAGGAYIVIGLGDYAYQLWQHEKQLRMSKQEVKQEMKQMEGDPMIKARRRSIARTLARRQMMQDVARADVVITNPTHIAVALRYDPFAAPAPVVVAMGQRKIAERIKLLAREHGVPCVENKPLARALLATARIGTMIPPELYVAVAEVLAFVMKSRNTRGNWTGSAEA